MKEILNWEELEITSDLISEDEIKSAEAMGKVPVGKYLCVCAGSTPKEKHFNNYSCFAANLKWQIKEAIVVDGKKVDPEEGAMWEGRFIFDEVALQNPDEKDGMRKRRILVAKRCGLISNASEEITKEMWFRNIIQKQVKTLLRLLFKCLISFQFKKRVWHQVLPTYRGSTE